MGFEKLNLGRGTAGIRRLHDVVIVIETYCDRTPPRLFYGVRHLLQCILNALGFLHISRRLEESHQFVPRLLELLSIFVQNLQRVEPLLFIGDPLKFGVLQLLDSRPQVFKLSDDCQILLCTFDHDLSGMWGSCHVLCYQDARDLSPDGNLFSRPIPCHWDRALSDTFET